MYMFSTTTSFVSAFQSNCKSILLFSDLLSLVLFHRPLRAVTILFNPACSAVITNFFPSTVHCCPTRFFVPPLISICDEDNNCRVVRKLLQVAVS